MRKILLAMILIGSFSSVTFGFNGDQYSFKLLENKAYSIKADLYVYQIYRNGEPFRIMNIYVTNGLEGSRILVDSDFNTSWNSYYFSKKRYFDNFLDSNRLQEFTANSIGEAVNMAVDHYVQDRIAQ